MSGGVVIVMQGQCLIQLSLSLFITENSDTIEYAPVVQSLGSRVISPQLPVILLAIGSPIPCCPEPSPIVVPNPQMVKI